MPRDGSRRGGAGVDVVLVLLTIVGTLGAVGGATVAAARSAGVWSPPALPGAGPTGRVRRLVSVSRLGEERSDGRNGVAPAVSAPTSARAAGSARAEGLRTVVEGGEGLAAERPEDGPALVGAGEVTPTPAPAPVPATVAGPSVLEGLERFAERQTEAVARLGAKQETALAEIAAGQAEVLADLGARHDAALTHLAARQDAALAGLAELAARQAEGMDGFAERAREQGAAVERRLGELDARLGGLDERLAAVTRDVASAGEAAGARRAAEETRLESALERLRADLLGGWAAREAALGEREERLARRPLGERRLATAAELYARLARLEAAVAAVTNPMLLPGEPFAPPEEFLSEALAWENWKDVGERAFAFADHYNTQRLLLGAPAGDEVAAFVSDLRRLLTRSVYPNLRPDPTPEQLAALRAALERLGEALPTVRGALAGEYRSALDGTPER